MEPNNAGKLTSCFENHINVETVFSDSVFAFFFLKFGSSLRSFANSFDSVRNFRPDFLRSFYYICINSIKRKTRSQWLVVISKCVLFLQINLKLTCTMSSVISASLHKPVSQ